MKNSRMFLFLTIVALYGIDAIDPASGRRLQMSGPGWIDVSADPVSPVKARRVLSELHFKAEGCLHAEGRTETEATPEMLSLARGLHYDPALIFEYVRNYYDYMPTFGSAIGGEGAFHARRGNDWDLASLLICLFRASGFSADYATGDVLYDLDVLANWVGAAEDLNVVSNIFYSGGIPVEVASFPPRLKIMRVWVQAEISGQTFVFDPAMKSYSSQTGIQLGQAIDYDHADFISRALEGASSGTDFVQSLNEANVQADMTSYSTNLCDYIRTHMPASTLPEIIGGREIVPEELETYPTSLPHALAIQNLQIFSEIPQIYRHLASILHAGIDYTSNAYQLAGKRITIVYRQPDGAPELRIDGALAATGNPTTPGTAYDLTVGVDHPYAAEGGTYADQSRTISAISGDFYCIVLSFESDSQELIDLRSSNLSRMIDQGQSIDSEAVFGESLMLAGMNYFVEESLFNSILNRIAGIVFVKHHAMGIVAQQGGCLIDVSGITSSTSITGDMNDRAASVRARALMGSAFEYGVLEQKQRDQPAVSTVRLIQLSDERDRKTFFANSANWSSIEPQLLHYGSGILSLIEAYLAAGWEAVLPEDAYIALNEWQGVGFIMHYSSGDTVGMGLIISGGYLGGQSSFYRQFEVNDLEDYERMMRETKYEWNTLHSSEPVDMKSGAFILNADDLTFGDLEPSGISFQRYYTSSRNASKSVLGRGWSHNYDVSANAISNPGIALGSRMPEEAAAAICGAYVLFDLALGTIDLPEWVVSSITARWLMDQMIGNAVTISLRNSTILFSRSSDGAFVAPPPSGLRLGRNGSNFYMTDPFGFRFDFNQNGKLETMSDSNGNALQVSYNANGQVERITDEYDRFIELSYQDDILAGASDYSGRSIEYGYSNENLTTYSDAMNKIWTYDYDSENRLISITRPRGNTVVTNVYDALGRVEQQLNSYNEAFSSFYYSGFRTSMDDAFGNRSVHIFDRSGRMIRFIDPEGNRVESVYDGLGNLIFQTDRMNGTVAMTYHRETGRLASQTNAEGGMTTFTYQLRTNRGSDARDPDAFYILTHIVRPDATVESFTHDGAGNVLTHTNRAGKTSVYSYNSHGQPLTSTNPAGGEIACAYNSRGELESIADPETGTIEYGYDALDRLTTVDYPDENQLVYSYDSLDRLAVTIDERGNSNAYVYDDNSNLQIVEDSAGFQTIYGFDDMDRMTSMTDRNGKTAIYAYDAMDRIAAMTDPNGVTISHGYDSSGMLDRETIGGQNWRRTFNAEGVMTGKTTPMSHSVTFTVNHMGYTTAVSDPPDATVGYQRDSMQRIERITDQLDRILEYELNGWNLLDRVTSPVMGEAVYHRDDLGNHESIVDFRENAWIYDYSPLGRMTAHADPLGNAWTHAYDDRGRLMTTTYPEGDHVTRTYDGAGNLIQRSYASGLNLNYAYDPDLNRMISARWLELAYDREGRIVSTVNFNDITFGGTFDDGGRLRTVQFADGLFTATYAYDPITGLLASVSDDLTGSQISFTYNADRLLTGMTRTNSANTSYERDEAGRITRIQHSGFADLRYTLDDAGQPVEVLMTAPLDPADHLLEMAQSFDYDEACQASSPGFSYDERGRLISAPSVACEWDSAGRLTMLNSALMDYNGMDDLVLLEYPMMGTTFYYNYSISSHPLAAERDESAGGWQRFYIQAPDGKLLYMIDATNANSVYFYHFDRMGNAIALTDDSGGVSDSYAYAPFGSELVHSGDISQPFRFSGEGGVRLLFPEHSIYKMGARWYDAETARFLTRDPISPDLTDPFALNPYQYANQNPVTFFDPFGTSAARTYCEPGGESPESRNSWDPHIDRLDRIYQFVNMTSIFIPEPITKGLIKLGDVSLQAYWLSTGGHALNFQKRYESPGARAVRLFTDTDVQNAHQVERDLNKPIYDPARIGAEGGRYAYEQADRVNLTGEENTRQVQKDLNSKGLARISAEAVHRIDAVINDSPETNAARVQSDLSKPLYHPARIAGETARGVFKFGEWLGVW